MCWCAIKKLVAHSLLPGMVMDIAGTHSIHSNSVAVKMMSIVLLGVGAKHILSYFSSAVSTCSFNSLEVMCAQT